MATGKLTALAVDRAHREGRPVMLCDGGGLYFRKQTRDGAAWTLRYRFAGRARWMTLGNYPDMSLADARIEARQKRAMLAGRRWPGAEAATRVESRRAGESVRRASQLAQLWWRELPGYQVAPRPGRSQRRVTQGNLGRIRFRRRRRHGRSLATARPSHEDRRVAHDTLSPAGRYVTSTSTAFAAPMLVKLPEN